MGLFLFEIVGELAWVKDKKIPTDTHSNLLCSMCSETH